jgi:hypothetical protein
MRRTRTLWEVFVLRFEEAMERCRKRRLTAEEAGELLGMSGRHFRRLLVRYEEEGADGLRDRRLGKPSPRGPSAHGLDPWRAPPADLTRMQILYQERYRDFTVKHFHEQLQKRHNYTLGYTVTRLALQAAGLVGKSKRRGGTHRKKRERRPLPGMLLFQSLPPRRRGSAAPWRSSASPISRPIRPRRAAAWSGCSAPSKAACRRSCGSPKSPPSGPPTARSKSSCPITTPASRCRQPRKARPSSLTPAGPWRTSCAFRKRAKSVATTASTGTGLPCRSRRSPIATITSRQPCGSTNTPTDSSPSSTGQAAWCGSTAPQSRSMSHEPLNPRRRQGSQKPASCGGEHGFFRDEEIYCDDQKRLPAAATAFRGPAAGDRRPLSQ